MAGFGNWVPGGCGTGGGGAIEEEVDWFKGGAGGGVTVGNFIAASLLRFSIFSLYASLSSLISLRPSLVIRIYVNMSKRDVEMVIIAFGGYSHSLAFLSSFSLYLSNILSGCCVARNRTS